MMLPSVDQLRIKIFADGADLKSMKESAANPLVKGFTTNPTLMRAAGVTDYKAFALDVLKTIPDRPVSFEVFADDFSTMEDQAREIASWGDNVYVKIPVTNTKGDFCRAADRDAVARRHQTQRYSGFHARAGQQNRRGACRGVHPRSFRFSPAVSPIPAAIQCRTCARHWRCSRTAPQAELLWASPRELLNIFQADEIGCHIITVTADVFKKLSLVGKNMADYSRETVTMFFKRCHQPPDSPFHLRPSGLPPKSGLKLPLLIETPAQRGCRA